VKFSLKSLAFLPALTLAAAFVGCSGETEETPPVSTGTPTAPATGGMEGDMATPPATPTTPAAEAPALEPAPAPVGETPAATEPATPDLSAPATPEVTETPSEPTEAQKTEGEEPKA